MAPSLQSLLEAAIPEPNQATRMQSPLKGGQGHCPLPALGTSTTAVIFLVAKSPTLGRSIPGLASLLRALVPQRPWFLPCLFLGVFLKQLLEGRSGVSCCSDSSLGTGKVPGSGEHS